MMRWSLAICGLIAFATPAQAHMQTITAPGGLLIQRPGELRLELAFGHPDGSGPMLDMPVPDVLTVIHEVQRSSLLDTLLARDGSPRSFSASVPVNELGDYVVVLESGAYCDQGERGCVQQFAKAIFNLGGVPSDWSDQVGMPVEIVPMVKPYAIPARSTFTGRVVTPIGAVPYRPVDLVRLTRKGGGSKHPWPGALSVVTDAEGLFTIGIPAAGMWALAAYGAGPQHTTSDGAPLTQDAILLVEAHDWFD